MAALSTTIEVSGQILNVEDALARNEKHGYCVDCGEAARPYRRSKDGRPAHIQHFQRNPDCKLSHHL
jgi:hypothetical protein